MDYFVYKFYNNENDVIYVGQTTSLMQRMYHHKVTKEWFPEDSKIEYCICTDKFMMDTYETYYILTLRPKYNIDFMAFDDTYLILPERDIYELKPKNIKSYYNPKMDSYKTYRVDMTESDKYLWELIEKRIMQRIKKDGYCIEQKICGGSQRRGFREQLERKNLNTKHVTVYCIQQMITNKLDELKNNHNIVRLKLTKELKEKFSILKIKGSPIILYIKD